MKAALLSRIFSRQPGILFLLTLMLWVGAFVPTKADEPPPRPGANPPRPRLVIGIVVDQMRYDHLYRYLPYYGKGGLRRLMDQGLNFTQAYYPYAPTVTGPGHSSIYTGSTPAFHGIALNNWFDQRQGRFVYCCQDPNVRAVGGDSAAGAMSPIHLQATTLGDELKLATNQASKVVSVCLKDRGAIFPGGRAANGAYWFDGRTGNFISSTWYGPTLPEWLQKFNARRRADHYMAQTWSMTGEPAWYDRMSTADAMPYEAKLSPKSSNTFPYVLREVAASPTDYDVVRRSGLGVHLTTEVALAALEGAGLGTDESPDLLAISYSSTDYVGHMFGMQSRESMDSYLRLDADIALLIDAAERRVGKGEVLIFITSDHGVSAVPEYLQSHRLPAGRYNTRQLRQALNDTLSRALGAGEYIRAISEEQVYLDHRLIAQRGRSLPDVERLVASILRSMDMVADAIASEDLAFAGAGTIFLQRLYLGHHHQRSGDVHFITRPGVLESTGTTGTTHSSVYEYDTHVPMLFYGWGIRGGRVDERVSITDITPTICHLLDMMAPSASIGRPRLTRRGRQIVSITP